MGRWEIINEQCPTDYRMEAKMKIGFIEESKDE